jgi:hypothetical protein
VLLDRILASYDFRERHETTVDAPPESVFGAVGRFTAGEIPLHRLLSSMRLLPGRLGGAPAPRPDRDALVLGAAFEQGFMVLAEQPGREVVLGTIGRSATPTGPRVPIRDSLAFAAFDTPGFVKAAFNFRVDDIGGRTRLSTETRVRATDPAERRKFARYWVLSRLGRGLLRRSWLRAVRRRAERELRV